MNIALPALLILFLVLPGITLSYAYRRGLWRSPVFLKPLQSELITGLFNALVLHVLALFLLNWLSIAPSLTEISLLIASNPKEVSIDEGVLVFFAYYFIGINLLAPLLGIIGHVIVRSTHLDLKYEFLRFRNEWFYLFSGEMRVFDSTGPSLTFEQIEEILADKVEFAFVSVVVEQGGCGYLYWGVLSNYYFGNDGSLDRIVLLEAQRRILDPGKDKPDSVEDDAEKADDVVEDRAKRFYPIDGDYVIIRYDDIKNLNVEYGALTELEDETIDY